MFKQLLWAISVNYCWRVVVINTGMGEGGGRRDCDVTTGAKNFHKHTHRKQQQQQQQQ